jgi:hypothetical protein
LEAQSKEADQVVNEMFAILARKSAASPEKTLESLRLATLQLWSGRKSNTRRTEDCSIGLNKTWMTNVDKHAVLAWYWTVWRSRIAATGPDSAQKAVRFLKDAWETACL